MFKVTANKELHYVADLRLPQEWKNEAAWAYLKGFIALSDEEEKLSMIKEGNAPRLHIKNFPWLVKLVDEWVVFAENKQFLELIPKM